ncbi:ABC transporter permease [Pseudonocardia sp.]|uniref:ABC transporter permease n=1 Tax=Pseudonocardia sp. TaxID=60912 RepID=UPI003D13523C
MSSPGSVEIAAGGIGAVPGPARRSRGASAVVAPIVFGLGLLVVWELVVRFGDVPTFLLPTPSAIAEQIVAQFPVILQTAAVTGGNALVGLVVGFVAGVLLAILAAGFRVVSDLVTPVVLAASAVPIVALAPVFTTMFGSTTEIPRRLVVAVVVVVPVFVSTARGLRQVRPVHDELMVSLAATRRQYTRFVRLPGAVPFVMTGLRLAAPAAVVAAIVAEYFGGLQNGLGSRITAAAANTAYARAWAFVAASIVLGLLFFLAGLLAERLVTRNRPGGG